ncbi:MAG: magnesium/cobalt transporter CorA, partial [Bacteroidia bacterium]
MTKFIKNRSNTIGKSPGSLTFIGNKKLENARIRVIKYNDHELIEKELLTIGESFDLVDSNHITWINIDGLHDSELFSEIEKRFNITSMALEDIMNTDHRPKLFEADKHITIVTKALEISENHKLKVDQVSFIIGPSYIISFQETTGTFFEPVRERIRNSSGRIRLGGSDYLCYALMDTLVDNYMTILTKFGEIIEEQEDKLDDTSNNEILNEIYALKKDTVILRKNIRPVKEVTNLILRSESDFFSSDSRIYFTDLDELLTQAIETIEIYYTLVNDHLVIYHTNVSNGANAVMKVLTIFASIFIPLTFIAGVYGTNFNYIPELGFRWGYFAMLTLMALVAIV